MEKVDAAIQIKGLSKKFKGFALDIPELSVPKGFSTALIGKTEPGKPRCLIFYPAFVWTIRGTLNFLTGGQIRTGNRQIVR